MARFKKRLSEVDVPEATGELTSRAAAYPTASEEPEPAEADAETTEAPDLPPAAESELPRVGEHVASVLQAAEDAAARLVEEAEARAKAIVEEAETAAARLRLEGEQAHSEAIVAAGELRNAADEHAARIRAEAEQDAETFGERAAAQHEDLLNDMAIAEDRLRRLVDGLHEVADHLNGLLEDDEDDVAGEEPEAGSLVEALHPDGSAARVPTE